MLDSEQSWRAPTAEAGAWMQIDAGAVIALHGVATQVGGADKWR